MGHYYVCCSFDLHLVRSVVDFSIKLRDCGIACVYFSFRWGPFMKFPRDCIMELH